MTKLNEQTDNPNQINQSRDSTVNSGCSLNNREVEPAMYKEHSASLSELSNRVTVIDIFDSEEDAKNAVLKIEEKGLLISHISIVAKNYKNSQSAINWESINAEGGLTLVLTSLGISKPAIARFIEAIDNGKFLIIEVGSDRGAVQVHQALEKSGRSFP